MDSELYNLDLNVENIISNPYLQNAGLTKDEAKKKLSDAAEKAKSHLHKAKEHIKNTFSCVEHELEPKLDKDGQPVVIDGVPIMQKISPEHFTEHFENALFHAKGGLIIILILVSLIYQVMYKKVQGAQTFLSSPAYTGRLIGDASITAIFGIFSCMFVIWSRHGKGALLSGGSLKTYAVVALILGLFNFAQEASGLNRYLAKTDIINKTGPYYQLDTQNTSAESVANLEAGGDPFIISMSYFFTVIVAVILIYYIFSMLKTTMCGFRSGYFNIGGNANMADLYGPYTVLQGEGSGGKLLIEILMVGFINFIPPMISPFVRGETFGSKSTMVAGFTMAIAMALQFMFQYTGMLSR